MPELTPLQTKIEELARQVWAVLPLLTRVLVNGIREQLGDTATVAQYRALEHVYSQPMTLSTLAKLRRVSLQSASDLVQSLVERGWMQRAPDPKDRRQSILHLTETGRAVYEQVRQQLTETLAGYLTPMNEGEVQALETTLNALQRVMSEGMESDGNS